MPRNPVPGLVDSVGWDLGDIYAPHSPDPEPEKHRFWLRAGIQLIEANLPDANPTYDVFRRIVSLMLDSGFQLSVTLSEDSVVEALHVTTEGSVERIWPTDGGGSLVRIAGSPIPFVIPPGVPVSDERRKRLEDAIGKRETVVIIAADDTHEIQRVESSVRELGEDRPFVELPDPQRVIDGLSGMPRALADELFAAAAGDSCLLPTGALDCLHFLYPDSGCWVRAERMCDLFRERFRVEAGKIWVYEDEDPPRLLRAGTENRPDCVVEWHYHVAPIVRLDEDDADGLLVIDPSVFCAPQPVSVWIETIGHARSRTVLTPADVYRQSRPYKGIEEGRGEMERELRMFFAALLCRSRGFPPPPFPNCRPCPNDP